MSNFLQEPELQMRPCDVFVTKEMQWGSHKKLCYSCRAPAHFAILCIHFSAVTTQIVHITINVFGHVNK